MAHRYGRLKQAGRAFLEGAAGVLSGLLLLGSIRPSALPALPECLFLTGCAAAVTGIAALLRPWS